MRVSRTAPRSGLLCPMTVHPSCSNVSLASRGCSPLTTTRCVSTSRLGSRPSSSAPRAGRRRGSRDRERGAEHLPRGLGRYSSLDRAIFEKFYQQGDQLHDEAAAILEEAYPTSPVVERPVSHQPPQQEAAVQLTLPKGAVPNLGPTMRTSRPHRRS
jgi:hypothetical protein